MRAGLQLQRHAQFRCFENVSISTTDGATVEIPGGVEITNDIAHAVPVVHTGTVELTATNFEIALADTVVNTAPVAVTAVVGALLASDATRRGFRVKNVGANQVPIGGAGLVFADAVLVIDPGEVFIENEAPCAAWFAVADTGLSSTLNIQEIGV